MTSGWKPKHLATGNDTILNVLLYNNGIKNNNTMKKILFPQLQSEINFIVIFLQKILKLFIP